MEGGRKMQKVGNSERLRARHAPRKQCPAAAHGARTERRESFVQAAKAVIRSGL